MLRISVRVTVRVRGAGRVGAYLHFQGGVCEGEVILVPPTPIRVRVGVRMGNDPCSTYTAATSTLPETA